MSQSRQLAAIMFTDIVGYTALMGRDSNKALELVRISKEIQKPLVEKHHGQWLKEMGDGALAKFGTALDAVNCAVEIQEIARGKLDAKLRIGLHLGDITIENDDVYGDGVNVAARLESIADPGGIYISDAIEKAIRGQGDIQAKYLGESRLKNVDYGVRTYAVQGVGLPIPEVKEDKQLSGQLWAEIQRRGVIRAAVAYVVAGLVLVLLLRETQNWITLPDWLFTVVLASLFVCFPIALYLAWNYERSPEGFVRTSSQESWRNPYNTAKRKPLTGSFVIAGLMLVIGIMYFYPSFQSSGQESETSESILESRVIDKSIVVLPFADMSVNKDQEYFSDGMMEEILNHLVKIEDLKVISRTTAMQYKGTTKSVHEITDELNVATALEGSVRKDGDQLRITVQLIEGNTDTHLWSESYDRQLTNIFEVQSDVAKQIALVLRAEISPDTKQKIEAQPTTNTEAYNLFLLAEQVRETDASHSIELYEKVIQMDPEFATAYARLGSLKRGLDKNSDAFEAVRIAKPYYEKALEIDPENYAGHLIKGQSHLWYEWDFEEADKEYQFLKIHYPNSFLLPALLLSSGRFKEALENSKRNIKTDPLNPTTIGYYIHSLYYNGQKEQVLEEIPRALLVGESNPQGRIRSFLLNRMAEVYQFMGMHQQSLQICKNQLSDDNGFRRQAILAINYLHLEQSDKTMEILQKMKLQAAESGQDNTSVYIALVYAQLEENDLAFEWLEKAYQDHESHMFWLKVYRSFGPLYSDPRWQVMLDKIGFPE